MPGGSRLEKGACRLKLLVAEENRCRGAAASSLLLFRALGGMRRGPQPRCLSHAGNGPEGVVDGQWRSSAPGAWSSDFESDVEVGGKKAALDSSSPRMAVSRLGKPFRGREIGSI